MSEFCSLCQIIETRPYCPNHGVVHRPFAIAERHDLEELIGTGAASFVFGGTQRTSGRPVAVKLLRSHVVRDSDAQQRFLREAAAASQISHENVVGIIDFGWDDEVGATYLAMDRLSGHPAEAMLRQSGPLPWQHAVPLLLQISRAVSAAHALGVSDGHLTARKVFVVTTARRPSVKLCDFGFSSLTVSAEDAAPLDDLYGFGTVAHELLTGRPPLEGSNAAGALSDNPIRMNERFPALALPRALDDLIQACRLRDPMLRPSLDEIEARLLALDLAAAAPSIDDEETVWASMEAAMAAPAPQAGAQAPAAGAMQAPAAGVMQAPAAGVMQAPATATPVPSRPHIALPLPLPAPPEAGMPMSMPAPVGSDPLALPEMIGSYRVVASLGTGGTGRVYLGQHPVIGSKVAIKVLLPEIASSAETVERFIQEARASSQIASPHIPRYFDFGTTPAGLPYAMMEYFDGETLGDRLARCGAMSVEETAQIVAQVASALVMAHETGLIHRDLKPDNIFLVRSDGKAGRSTPARATAITPAGALPVVAPSLQVKVLDFGIAKTVGAASATRTQNGYFLGTPFYCAPEQVFGGEVDARTDVYSLGATAFEMLTGSPPFVGEVPDVLAAKATTEAPDLLVFRDVPPPVAHTINRMLARDPDERAISMAWVLEQLPGWLAAPESAAAMPAAVTSAVRTVEARSGRSSAPTLEVRARASAPVIGGTARAPSVSTGKHEQEWFERGAAPSDGRPAETAEAADAAVRATGFAAEPSGRHAAPAARDAVPRSISSDRDPASTSQAIRAVAIPKSSIRTRAALAIGGGVAFTAALILVIRVASSPSTSPEAPPQPDVKEATAGSAVAPAAIAPASAVPAAAAPAAAAPDPAAPDPTASAPAAVTAPAPVVAPASAAVAGDDAAIEITPLDAAGAPSKPAGSSPHDKSAAGSGAAAGDKSAAGSAAGAGDGSARHRPKQPADKKPPTKKAGESKDVLIVDPFSHGN